MFKKTLTGLLSLILFVSFSPAVAAYEYEDVPRNSEYFYPVDYLRRNDVFKDTKYFYPDLLINKAEFIKYLVMLNSPEFQPSNEARLPFQDTKDTAWYAPYFKEAIDLGILDEREKKVEPYKKLTVIDALTLLFHSQSIPIPNVYKGSIPYTDVERNKATAPLIMRALELDLIRPKEEDTVGIYQRVTRAQAARMIYKLDLATLGTPTSNGLTPVQPEYPFELKKLISAWEKIRLDYLHSSEIDETELTEAAIRAMVEKLDDPYSIYLDQEENKNFFDDIDGQVEGIGAVIGYNDKKEITIVSPIKEAPADKAGLKSGDIIESVDGVEVGDLDPFGVAALIKGPRGTSVEIQVKRKGYSRTFSVVRDLIDVPAMDYEMIGNDIMLVNFYQFNENAPSDFEEVVNEIGSNSNVMGMVIDLRDNPGGLLDAVIRILGFMVEKGSEVVEIKYPDFSQSLLSHGTGSLVGFPIVVLINEGSASASEIMAGTLQDYGLATIVGSTSFGKGTVQEINYFNDNSSLKLTIAQWLTPAHQEIDKNGIFPDVEVEDLENTEKDEQLETAITELRKLMHQ